MQQTSRQTDESMISQDYLAIPYSLSYSLFFALSWLSKERKGNRLLDKNGLTANTGTLILLHIGGILLFGMVPLFSNHPSSFKLYDTIINNPVTWITLFSLVLLVIFSLWIAEKTYNELVRIGNENTSLSIAVIIAYFLIRVVFIYVYENWFRGYLLHDCISVFGLPWAILLNVAVYSLLHWVNGKDEMLACIPLGLLLCGLCIWQRAVWPAVLLHLSLTITYEISLLIKIRTRKALRYENIDNRGLGIYR